jgi:hypothetical protein
MYLLTEDLGSLAPDDDSPKQLEFSLIVDCTTSVRRSGHKKYWKVHSAEVTETGLHLTVRQAYCRKTSKKYKLGLIHIPFWGFKRISDCHLALNYRDASRQLQTLIITSDRPLAENRKVHIKEVFITA